jgi:pimeloyl-ACP methyl ester carboxylesterase
VIGADGERDAREKLKAFTLKGILKDAKCPVMVTHGQDDTLVTVEAAQDLPRSAGPEAPPLSGPKKRAAASI